MHLMVITLRRVGGTYSNHHSLVIVPAFHAGTSQRCSRGDGCGGGGGGGQMMMMMINHQGLPTQLKPHPHSWSKDSIVG